MIWVFNGRKKEIKMRKRKILKRLVGDGIIFILGGKDKKKEAGKRKCGLEGKVVWEGRVFG